MFRKLLFLPLIVIFSAVVDTHGQILPPVDTTPEQQRRESDARIEAERETRLRNMREFDLTMKVINRPATTVPASPTIDKETAARITAARRVDAADVFRYNEFLKADKSGMFKLLPDHDCVTKDVVRIDGDCKDFVMASSSFSFRTVSYVHAYYHDLGLNNGEIFSNAFLSQGIIVSLGDVPIESVGSSSEGLKFIFDFQTVSDPAAAKQAATRLKAGINVGGFTYSSFAGPAVNTTYVLRSIGYDIANSLPKVSESTSLSELRFHTLPLDKRADVIVVFRIVRIGSDGGLTIVWKELAHKEAPKLKFPKGAKFVDFKPN